jgi:hypothetical protein
MSPGDTLEPGAMLVADELSPLFGEKQTPDDHNWIHERNHPCPRGIL